MRLLSIGYPMPHRLIDNHTIFNAPTLFDYDAIIVDPGIGFGKSAPSGKSHGGHNIEILQRLGLFHDLGCPVLLGVSRKSFIDRLAGVDEPKQRLPGSLAAGLAGLDKGVQILRVHDVAETVQALAVWRALTADLSNDS